MPFILLIYTDRTSRCHNTLNGPCWTYLLKPHVNMHLLFLVIVVHPHAHKVSYLSHSASLLLFYSRALFTNLWVLNKKNIFKQLPNSSMLLKVNIWPITCHYCCYYCLIGDHFKFWILVCSFPHISDDFNLNFEPF